MKNILLFFGMLISLLFLSASCQDNTGTNNTKDGSDLSISKSEENTTKKAIHFKEQWVTIPPGFDTLLLSYVEKYDKRGNLIEKKEYSPEGELIIHTKKVYNEYNDEIHTSVANLKANVALETSMEIEYVDGKKTKWRSKTSTGKLTESEYIYYENGDYKWSMIKDGEEIEYILYNKDGQNIENSRMNGQMVQKYKYDEHGNAILRTRKATIHPEEVLEYINEYNSEGQLIKKRYGNKIEEYTYDQDGNVKSETWYFVDEKTRGIEYKYQYY